MRTLELADYLELTGKNVHGLAVELGLSPPKVHYWFHNTTCMIKFDDYRRVHEMRLMREKVVYAR